VVAQWSAGGILRANSGQRVGFWPDCQHVNAQGVNNRVMFRHCGSGLGMKRTRCFSVHVATGDRIVPLPLTMNERSGRGWLLISFVQSKISKWSYFDYHVTSVYVFLMSRNLYFYPGSVRSDSALRDRFSQISIDP